MKNQKLKEAVLALSLADDAYILVSTIGGCIDVKSKGSDIFHVPVNKQRLKSTLIKFLEEEMTTNN